MANCVLLLGILTQAILGQVIINTEPNKLVDGESGNNTCSYTKAYLISINRISGNIVNCPVSKQTYACSVSQPGPKNNYTDYRKFYTFSKTGTSVTIHIETVSKQRDDGYWGCKKTFILSSLKVNITIDVKVPVKGVEIENKNSLQLLNGLSTTMKCRVTNNPDPVINYRWFIVETNQTLSTTSPFQLIPNKNQNGLNLSCSANNGYGRSKSDTVILDVKYKPSVKIEPEVSGNYRLIEGHTVELKCVITDANPRDAGSLMYTWYKDTTTPTGHVGSTVRISQKGIYRCSVSNGIGTGISDYITIDVLFPPRVNVTPQYSIIEFNTLTIPCIATSNPVPNNYTWSGPNNLLQSQQNLTISRINRDQTGQYTCTVSNIMVPTTGGQQTSTVTDDTYVTVLYSNLECKKTSGCNKIMDSGENSDLNSGFGAGVGTGVGISVAIVVMVIAAICIYRYLSGKQKKGEKIYDGFNTTARSDDAQTYQELDTMHNTARIQSDDGAYVNRYDLNIDGGRTNVGRENPNIDGGRANVNRENPNIDGGRANVGRKNPNIDRVRDNVNKKNPNKDGGRANVGRRNPNIDGGRANIGRKNPNIDGGRGNVVSKNPNIDGGPTIDGGRATVGRKNPNINDGRTNVGRNNPNIDDGRSNVGRNSPNIDDARPYANLK